MTHLHRFGKMFRKECKNLSFRVRKVKKNEDITNIIVFCTELRVTDSKLPSASARQLKAHILRRRGLDKNNSPPSDSIYCCTLEIFSE